MLIKTLNSIKDKMSLCQQFSHYKIWIFLRRTLQQIRTNAQVNANLFWCAKEVHYRRFKIFILFIDLSEFYMLQINFAKTERRTLRIPIFNFNFNSNKDSVCVVSTDKFSRILGPKHLKLSRPLQTDFTNGKVKSALFCNSYLHCLFCGIISLHSAPAKPPLSLNISMARKRKFHLWIETKLNISSNSIKVDFLSL